MPQTETTWFKDNIKLEEGPFLNLTTLTIPSVKSEDEGTYYCLMKTNQGYSYKHIMVKISGRYIYLIDNFKVYFIIIICFRIVF